MIYETENGKRFPCNIKDLEENKIKDMRHTVFINTDQEALTLFVNRRNELHLSIKIENEELYFRMEDEDIELLIETLNGINKSKKPSIDEEDYYKLNNEK